MIDALSRSHYNPKKDELYPFGDFCDRVPNPIKVLGYIYSLPNCHPVIGNHDLYLICFLTRDRSVKKQIKRFNYEKNSLLLIESNKYLVKSD